MKWLGIILKAFFESLLGLLKKETQTMEVGHSNGDTEKRLHDKINDTWSKPSDPK